MKSVTVLCLLMFLNFLITRFYLCIFLLIYRRLLKYKHLALSFVFNFSLLLFFYCHFQVFIAVIFRKSEVDFQAIRVLLRAIDSHANCYGRYIEPLLSVSIDYYLRVFVRLHTSALIAKDSVM